MKKLVIIPAYNEAKNLRRLIDEIHQEATDFDYIIIDDGSTDHTIETCRDNTLNVVHLPVNLGIGGAVQTGYMYASRYGYDIAVQVDGDGQHNPAFLHNIISPILADSAQFVIGSRYIEKTGFQSSIMRRFGINWLSFLLTRITGVRITDATSGFRAAGKDVIRLFSQRYPIDYPEPETLCELSRKGVIMHEIPVEMRERQHGTSSIRPAKAIYYMSKVTVAVLISRWMKRR